MPDRTEHFIVEQSLPGGRLDVFLREKFPAVSRGALQRLIEQGHIRVNGQMVKPTHAPRAGEQVEVYWPEARATEAQPEDIPLDILFEDASLLVINKPPGLVVHPAAGHEEHTLVNALLHHCGESLSGIGGVARPGIVHRLDKETSGCLVVAKNDEAHLALARQFEEAHSGEIIRRDRAGRAGARRGRNPRVHRAVVHPTHRKRMAVRDGGESRFAQHELSRARTSGACHARGGGNSYWPKHTKSACISSSSAIRWWATTPHGAKANKRFAESTGYTAPRVLLHARKLSFVHPRTGKQAKFTAPLPEDFEAALRFLRV